MDVTRGDLVLAAGPGEYTGKPRPFLVVQSDAFNPMHPSVSLCPVTGDLTGAGWIRIAIPSTPDTGLDRDSEVQIDKVQTLRRHRIVRMLGRAPDALMRTVDTALRRWLDL